MHLFGGYNCVSEFVLLVPCSEGMLNQCNELSYSWFVLAMKKAKFSSFVYMVSTSLSCFRLLRSSGGFLATDTICWFWFQNENKRFIGSQAEHVFLVLLSLFFHHML